MDLASLCAPPPFLLSLSTEEGLKPSLCALASSVLPEGIAFCSSLIRLQLVPVVLSGDSGSTWFVLLLLTAESKTATVLSPILVLACSLSNNAFIFRLEGRF